MPLYDNRLNNHLTGQIMPHPVIEQNKIAERKRLKELKEKGTDKLSKEEMKELLDILIDLI